MKVVAQKKLWDCHSLKYLATKQPFSILYAINYAKGAEQGSPFNTSANDSQPIIDKNMGGGDHQAPQEIGTKVGHYEKKRSFVTSLVIHSIYTSWVLANMLHELQSCNSPYIKCNSLQFN